MPPVTLVTMGFRYDQDSKPIGLVAVCDTLLSNSGTSTQLPYGKINSLGSSWLLGYAGDPSYYMQLDPLLINVESLAPFEVAEAVKKAYVRVRKRQIEDRLLGSLGIDLATLYDRGRSIFGDDAFKALCESIDEYKLNLSLLLGGWSKANGSAFIFRIDNPGTWHDALITGYDAIGTGAEIALGHLHACYERHSVSLDWTLARLLEAKFMSEAQRNVGQATVAATMTADSPMALVKRNRIQKYRERWEEQRATIPAEWLSILEGS
jgi:hypothetical protein